MLNFRIRNPIDRNRDVLKLSIPLPEIKKKLLTALFGGIEKKEFMKELSQEEWKSKLEKDDKAVILDVRTEQEVEDGYIPTAKNLDIYKGQGFVEEVEKLDKDKNYYIYCRSGQRSAQACIILDKMGFANTYNLAGGFIEWQGEKVED